jgi:uncharacterized Tic20 family protein
MVQSSQSKTNAMLAWLFAPITSFIWKDDADAFVKEHARQSLYLGIANIAVFAVLFLLQICYGIIFANLLWSVLWGISALISCFWSLLWLAASAFAVVPRIIGIVKANDMKTWEVPYVTKFMSRFIKL